MAQVAVYRTGIQVFSNQHYVKPCSGASEQAQKPFTRSFSVNTGSSNDVSKSSTYKGTTWGQQAISNERGYKRVHRLMLDGARVDRAESGRIRNVRPGMEVSAASLQVVLGRKGRHVCRAAAGEGVSELSELEKVQKLDKLIDKLREASDRELPQIVAQNVMELDQVFWLRMATRADVCTSEDDKEDFMELSQRVMTLVHKIVQKTTEKIDDNAGVLEMVLDAAAEGTGEWLVPLSKERINAMKKVMEQRQEYLDETFLASVFAYSRKVEKENMGSMLVVLQRVMQLWASWYMTRHPKGRLNKDKKTPEEAVLERVLKADVEDWDPILQENLVSPGSKLNEEKFFNTIQSRMERSILYMENGSYSQRVVAEFLREIQARSQNIMDAARAPPPEIKFDNAER